MQAVDTNLNSNVKFTEELHAAKQESHQNKESQLNSFSNFNTDFDVEFNDVSFLRAIEENPTELLNYIESHPEYADIVEKAKDPNYKIKPNLFKKGLQSIKDLFIVNSKDLYGKGFVSSKLEKDTQNAATIMTTANLLNCAPSYSFILMAVISFPMGNVIAALAMLGLLKFSNACATVASTKRAENRWLSRGALSGLVSLNVFLTLISGPGTELTMNMEGLSDNLAREVIAERVLGPHVDKEAYYIKQQENAKFELQAIEQQLNDPTLSPDDRNKLILDKHGPFSRLYDSQYWEGVELTQRPYQQQAAAYAKLSKEKNDDITQLQEEINEAGGPLAYLQSSDSESLSPEQQAMLTKLYDGNFNEDGSIKSSYVASRKAFENFFGSLGSILNFGNDETFGEEATPTNWTSLGFTLFIFSLSIVTSGVAVYLTQTHANREDVRESFDDEMYQAQEEFFNALVKGVQA